MKFNRNYEFTITIPDTKTGLTQILNIRYPLTISFNIQKSATMKLNTAKFSLYNLKESTRKLLFQDRYDIPWKKTVEFKAGYLNQDNHILYTLFKGNIIQSKTIKSGPDFITEIICQDGQFNIANALANVTMKQGASGLDFIKNLASVTGLIINKTGDLGQYNFPNGLSLNGNMYDELQKVYNNSIFVEDEMINVLDEYEVIANPILVINSKSGFKNIPYMEGRYVVVEMVFEPNAKVGILCKLESQYEKIYNGLYKSVGVTHSGVISDRLNGDLTTTLQLFIDFNKKFKYI